MTNTCYPRREARGSRALSDALPARVASPSSHSQMERYSLGELVLGLLLLDGLGLLGLLLIELHKLGKIELGLLEELDLSDEDVLEREDLRGLLNDLLAKGILDAKDIINN